MQQLIMTMKAMTCHLNVIEELSEEVIGQCIYDEEIARQLREDKARQIVEDANYGADNYWINIQEDI